MKIRILAGIAVLALALVQSAALAQRGGGGKPACSDVPLRWEFADEASDRITSDGLPYDGNLFACGSNDAVINLLTSKQRWVNFNFEAIVSGQPEGWMTGTVPLKVHLNIHRLGVIRDGSLDQDENGFTTTFLTAQIEGTDRKTYRLRMTPEEVETGLTPSPADVNSPPSMTSPASVTYFTPGDCPNVGCTNQYGMWVVIGREQPSQVGTIYRVQNTWIKVGQFSLPFKATITALAPLPLAQ